MKLDEETGQRRVPAATTVRTLINRRDHVISGSLYCNWNTNLSKRYFTFLGIRVGFSWSALTD